MGTPRRLRLLVAQVALIATLGLVASCGSAGQASQADDANTVRSTSTFAALAPLVGLDTLEGTSFSPDLPEGRPAVVWFWAPWCPSCRAMGPGIGDLAAEHDGQIEVIGVAGRGEVDEMHEFVDDTGTGGIDHLIDADGSIWAEYGVVTQPALAFVASDGSVEMLIGRQSDQAMAERFQQLLGS